MAETLKDKSNQYKDVEQANPEFHIFANEDAGYTLLSPSRGREKELRRIIIKTSGADGKDPNEEKSVKQQICEIEKFDENEISEEYTPDQYYEAVVKLLFEDITHSQKIDVDEINPREVDNAVTVFFS